MVYLLSEHTDGGDLHVVPPKNLATELGTQVDTFLCYVVTRNQLAPGTGR